MTRSSRPSGIWARAVRAVVGTIGAGIIYALIWLLGRTVREEDVPWLAGPTGGDHIGDAPYQETAEAEGLLIERDAEHGGLLQDFGAMESDSFDPAQVAPAIREFYEHTAHFQLDTWATTHFPANIALWLLVTTISRRVDQLNFPLDALDTARGMNSEIVLLRAPEGAVVYTGWYRTLASSGRTLYTGFYTSERLPAADVDCVKTVFPMPGGNATVLLRPSNRDDGGLELLSKGTAFGDAGFYRVQRRSNGRLRVWRIRSLVERLRLFVDDDGDVRCDHDISFLGLRVLRLHYRCRRVARASSSADVVDSASERATNSPAAPG